MDESARDVGRFILSENCKNDSEDEYFLAGLQLFPKSNAPGTVFKLGLVLSCDVGLLFGADSRYGYEVRLKQCKVFMKTINCTADFGSGYSYSIPIDEVDRSIDKIERTEQKKERGIVGKISSKMSFRDNVAISADAVLESNKSKSLEKITKLNMKRHMQIIACHGNSWTVGDNTESDPRWGGFLFARYFNEMYPQELCIIHIDKIAAIKDQGQAKVVAFAKVRFGQLKVNMIDALGNPDRPIGREYAEDVKRALKERIRGLVLAKAMRQKQKNNYPGIEDSEFIIAEDQIIADFSF